MNDKILQKTLEIVNYIKNSQDYIKYQQLVEQIKNNKEIMAIINEVKSLQKQAVKKQHYKEDTTMIDEQIELNILKLNNYPIYQEMTYLQEDLDNIFTSIKTTLDDYIFKQIN